MIAVSPQVGNELESVHPGKLNICNDRSYWRAAKETESLLGSTQKTDFHSGKRIECNLERRRTILGVFDDEDQFRFDQGRNL